MLSSGLIPGNKKPSKYLVQKFLYKLEWMSQKWRLLRKDHKNWHMWKILRCHEEMGIRFPGI